MKKLMLVLAIAGFVACNNNSEGTDATADTTTIVTPDTAVIAPLDTTGAVVDTTAAGTTVDTTK